MQSCSSATVKALANADPEQARLMAERVILVDADDKVCGHMSKAESHMVSNDLPLHRAFSVFLFNSEGKMLLQQRAATKVTFPSYWTNTVCSHPLYRPVELGEQDRGDEVAGTKRAAIRKLGHELGIEPGAIGLEDLHFLTRILYRAECDDGVWGEHELDYIFFAQKDVHLNPYPNEIDEVRYVDQKELQGLYDAADDSSSSVRLTPWFRHVVDSFGWNWWKELLAHGPQNLSKHADYATIHRVGMGVAVNK